MLAEQVEWLVCRNLIFFRDCDNRMNCTKDLNKFRDEIVALINFKQEGPYWDFKRQWYDDKHESDKLLDIICMSNNLVDKDAYIIIGVDEEKDYELCDVLNDPNRRKTQDLVNFIRGKKFAGEFRPTVTVQSLEIENTTIDVIVIHNNTNTPFFLKENFQGIKANNIYVRYQDGNTPRDNSADFHNIEYLWKKRFGILLSPMQKLQKYLCQTNDWENVPGLKNRKYYKFAPEYTITFSWNKDDSSTRCEYYFFDHCDQTPHWGRIRIAYHQTVLQELTGIGLDGARFSTVAPITAGLFDSDQDNQVWYRYMIKGEMHYLVHMFYANQGDNSYHEECRIYESDILIFENQQERKLFLNFARTKWKNKDSYANEIYPPTFPQIANLLMEKFEEDFINMKILIKMLYEFRSSL